MKKSFAFVFIIFLASVSLFVPVAHATTCDPEDTSSTNGGCAATEYCDANNGNPICKAQSSFSATAPNAAAGTLPTATPAATTAAAPTPTAATPAAATPVTTSSASNNFVTLTQLPQIKQIAQTSNLAGLFNLLYELAIGVGSAVALLEIIYAGITWMTAGDSTEKVRSAKNRIRNTLLGLVLLLSPTVVFSIINPNILNFSVFTDDLKSIAVQSASPASRTAIGTAAGTTNASASCGYTTTTAEPGQCAASETAITGSCCTGTLQTGFVCCGSNSVATSASNATESQVRSALAAAGVTINHANACTAGQTSGCTSVAGFQSATIDQIIDVKKVCGSAEITGGTEQGHASGDLSHANGYKVDLSTAIDSCITSGASGYFTANGKRDGSDGGPQYKDKCGNVYVREANVHWDITVTSACTP